MLNSFANFVFSFDLFLQDELQALQKTLTDERNVLNIQRKLKIIQHKKVIRSEKCFAVCFKELICFYFFLSVIKRHFQD